MTIKVSICNTDLHRTIIVTELPRSRPDNNPTGTRHPTIVGPLTTKEFYVHEFQHIEIEELKP
jgi:hypothetical protein